MLFEPFKLAHTLQHLSARSPHLRIAAFRGKISRHSKYKRTAHEPILYTLSGSRFVSSSVACGGPAALVYSTPPCSAGLARTDCSTPMMLSAYVRMWAWVLVLLSPVSAFTPLPVSRPASLRAFRGGKGEQGLSSAMPLMRSGLNPLCTGLLASRRRICESGLAKLRASAGERKGDWDVGTMKQQIADDLLFYEKITSVDDMILRAATLSALVSLDTRADTNAQFTRRGTQKVADCEFHLELDTGMRTYIRQDVLGQCLRLYGPERTVVSFNGGKDADVRGEFMRMRTCACQLKMMSPLERKLPPTYTTPRLFSHPDTRSPTGGASSHASREREILRRQQCP
jgi:hypothetical protein